MPIRLNGSTSGRIEIDAPAVAGTTDITLPATAGEILVGTANGSVNLPTGTTAQRPASPQAGAMRFNTTTGQVEYWASTDDTPQWRPITETPVNEVAVEYLVVGGGGAGGGQNGGGYYSDGCGGGGAGGFRTNFGSGNISGGNSAVEAAMTLNTNVEYDVVVGAGGVASSTTKVNGSNSEFNGIISTAGGGGATGSNGGVDGNSGGSGGGGCGSTASGGSGGAGTTGQGFAGGSKGSNQSGGGGGGAGATGGSGTNGTGGVGISSSITGTATFYAGGGGAGGHGDNNGLAGGSGGGGRGGDARNNANITAGTANTGGGGGGGSARENAGTRVGANGGSGVVILRIPNTRTATFSAGLTASQTSTPDSDRVYTVTAGSGTVTFS